MTQQEIIERGIRAEELLKNTTFQQTVEDLIKLLNEQFLASAPEETSKRENAYFAYQGVKDVVGLLNLMVQAKDQIAAEQNAANDEMD